MSRSYRTQKESLIAERRIARYEDGSIVFPPIIERSPKIGDIHPLSKSYLMSVLPIIPIEYLYGLDRIELKAREKDVIGRPFALYRRDEKAIILYSLPIIWRMQSGSKEFAKTLLDFYADLSFDDSCMIVTWNEPVLMSLWYYLFVFTHELGHHFVNQYKHKNGRLLGVNHNELIANLISKRFINEFFSRISKKKTSTGNVNL